ncbi:hypothetical protein [Vannielia sp.]|uniref:hypothetical protein n=1 Tax=Vannielia sp. TaxID=2813045 RepID=UPI002614BDB4|nr:hypothetical protein [Vannielia sp.]MDF1872935.1 hypothetical protein [Vannielia sp.]
MQRISFKLSEAAISGLMSEAQKDDVSVGQLLRDAVKRELRRRHPPAKTPRRADEQLVARLSALLAPAFAAAQSWGDLNRRLRKQGYELVPAGGGLALHETEQGERLCKASEMGYGYARLIRRFGQAFPGHSHRWLAERVLKEAQDERFDVFE